MDFFSHLAWAYLLFPKGDAHTPEILFLSVLPDLFFVGAGLAYSVNLFARTRTIRREKAFPFVLSAYRTANSLLTFLAILAAGSLFTGYVYYPALAYLLHIALDLWTHKGSPVEPQMPLYPMREPAVRGWIWWRHPYFLVANWAAISLAFFFRG